jgi:hypothetical protein
MFFKLFGVKKRIHIGTIQATPVPTDRLEEEAPGTWTIHRVSLETTEGEILSKGFGIAGRWDTAVPKEQKASDKEADAPTPQKSEDVVTPVSPTEVMPTEKADARTPEEAAKAEAAVAAYEESHRDHFGFNIEDDNDDYYSDPTMDLMGAAVCLGFM